ncbi:MAG: sugar ABC transporter permease [Oscillospiraceae bacterium]|nr:sugar ABC transporter permease [Oscillospiraceae bacterium]
MSAKKKNKTVQAMKKHRDAYLLAAPFLVLFLVFFIAPVVMTVVLSFFSYEMTGLPSFAGFDNFRDLFMFDGKFSQAMANSMLIFAAAGIGGLVLSVLAAWGLEYLNKRIADIITAMLFVMSITGTVTAAVWLSGGLRAPLNSLLLSAGLTDVPVDWLSDGRFALPCVIFSQLWTMFGLGFLALRRGFREADRERADAAKIEGVKNPFWTLIFAQLPSVWPHLAFAALIQISCSFTNSEVVRILTGTPAESFGAYGMLTYIFDRGERLDAGRVFAAGLIMIIIITAVYAAARIVINKLAKYNA